MKLIKSKWIALKKAIWWEQRLFDGDAFREIARHIDVVA